jgi:GT2 family glycosyltransferase
MWKEHTVSVVLPTYNEKESIRQSIHELESTGYVDEIIVVNNNAAGHFGGGRKFARNSRARQVRIRV